MFGKLFITHGALFVFQNQREEKKKKYNRMPKLCQKNKIPQVFRHHDMHTTECNVRRLGDGKCW